MAATSFGGYGRVGGGHLVFQRPDLVRAQADFAERDGRDAGQFRRALSHNHRGGTGIIEDGVAGGFAIWTDGERPAAAPGRDGSAVVSGGGLRLDGRPRAGD